MFANLAVVALCNMHIFATMLLQGESSVGWDPISLWKQMGLLAKAVVIILFVMSGWSIGVMIDRWMAFNAARNQSRSFAPAVAGALREGKIDEAIKEAPKNWSRLGRAAESLSYTLYSARDYERCAARALELYPRVKGTYAAFNVSSNGLACASEKPENRATFDALEKAARETREVTRVAS